MINFINSWAQGIILAVIIACLIEMILPEGNNKKYVKTILGIYIMFVIIHPLISKISNKDINIQRIMEDTTSKMSELNNNNNITIETNAYIEETYKQKIEEDINKKMKEKGYDINSLNLYIETEDDENYGEINSIVMQISKLKDSTENNDVDNKNITYNTVNKIENIQVVISNTSTNQNSNIQHTNISKEEIDNLKEYLNKIYMIQKEKIYINE